MKPNVARLLAGVLIVGGLTPALGAGLADMIKVEVVTDVRQPGMEPGMYVCSAGHLHIRGTVRNLADVTAGQITLAGKALDANGKVAGPRIREVKKHDVRVVDAPPAR